MNPQGYRLTFRQVEFCRHYALGHSCREAARRAGYTPLFAKKKGHLLLRHPAIAYRIRQMQNSTRFVSDFHYESSVETLIRLMHEGTNEDRVKLRAALAIASLHSRQPMLPPDLLEGLEELEAYGTERDVRADAARQAREGDTALAEALILERVAELAEDLRELNVPIPGTDGTYDLQSLRPSQDVPGTMEHFEAGLRQKKEEKQNRIEAPNQRRRQKRLAQANPATSSSEYTVRAQSSVPANTQPSPKQAPPSIAKHDGEGPGVRLEFPHGDAPDSSSPIAISEIQGPGLVPVRCETLSPSQAIQSSSLSKLESLEGGGCPKAGGEVVGRPPVGQAPT